MKIMILGSVILIVGIVLMFSRIIFNNAGETAVGFYLIAPIGLVIVLVGFLKKGKIDDD
jgi:hypothetical protein